MAEEKEIGIVRRIGIAMRHIAENGGVSKGLKIPMGKGSFNARGIDDVMDKVCAALIASELVLTQKYAVIKSEFRNAPNGGIQHIAEISGEFEIYSPCGAKLDYKTIGMGVDNGDKAFQKAQTGAYKYFLAQALAIPYSGLQFENESENQPIAPTPPPVEKPEYVIKPEIKARWRDSILKGDHTAKGIVESLKKRFLITGLQRNEIYAIEIELIGEIAQRELNKGVSHDDISTGFRERLGNYYTDDLEELICSLNPESK